MTRKINDAELLRLAGEGVEQKEIARLMNCAPPSISKRLKRLRAAAARPAILDTLTVPQQNFVVEIANGKSQTAAALSAYSVGSLGSAQALGSKLANTPAIREAVTAVLETKGLTRGVLAERLKNHVTQTADASVSLKAVKLGFSLHGDLITRSENLNINATFAPVNLDKYRNR